MLNISYTTLHYYTDVTALVSSLRVHASLSALRAGRRLPLAYISSGCHRVHQSLARDYVWYLHGEYSMKEGFLAFAILNKGGLLYTTIRPV